MQRDGRREVAGEYTEQLKAAGAELVAVLPDNDPPGEAHAVAVARACVRASRRRYVQLPGLGLRGDISDWLAAGHEPQELVALVEDATDAGTTAEDAAPATAGPVLIRLSEVQAEEICWAWPSRIARGKLSVIIGDPGDGKSFLTVDIAARISAGAFWPDGGRPRPAT